MQFLSLDHRLRPLDLSSEWQMQRCFLYGDGHFTTAKIVAGSVSYLNRHMARLQQASERLKIAKIDYAQLSHLLKQLVEDVTFGVLKVQISRGKGIRGYGKTLDAEPTVFIWVTKTDKKPVTPGSAKLTRVDTSLGHSELLSGIKHCNRLEQVLVARELEEKGFIDGLVSDRDGNLIETSKANVFWYSKGQWYTPDLSLAGVSGVMREVVLSQIDAQQVKEKTEKVLANCSAMFICNSLLGIQAVESIDDQSLSLDAVEEVKRKLKFEHD